ncbi:hypothetical protein Tco_1178683, partial [Tanacetum coccineum]
SHADADVDSVKRCGTSNTFDAEYRVLKDLILHHSSINNSASLSNKFRGFYFGFKFGISGFLHQVVAAIADRIRDNEPLEYMDAHDHDASESSQPSWGKIVYVGEVVYSTSLSMVRVKYYVYMRRIVADFLHIGMLVWGEADSETLPKGVYEEIFSRYAAWIGGKLIQLMHTTMVPKQVKTRDIQDGVQVS